LNAVLQHERPVGMMSPDRGPITRAPWMSSAGFTRFAIAGSASIAARLAPPSPR
jgi:hypothetical protein